MINSANPFYLVDASEGVEASSFLGWSKKIEAQMTFVFFVK